MLKKLVLFDIDGTLLKVGNINRQVLADALMAVYGTEGNVQHHDFSGKMDNRIIYEVLQHAGLSLSLISEKFDAVKATYIDMFRKKTTPSDVTLLEGVRKLLQELSNRTDQISGLLTGNFEASGRHKLTLPDINHYFSFGAFADDAHHRDELPAIAVERAYQLTGKKFSASDVVIIGDTRHDIQCAKVLKARSIAVATGNFSSEELQKHSPDVLFENLAETALVIDKIFNN
ncbi:MAG: HAD hydrolase-like protein [Chlorobiaceae bacterium]|jgi:phosphoglycolate phosphatase|nr:HAD hydrolase-like protein [Chlorobiaceae bacterium]NTW62654.1 HAD hydrolase-like protein [Chlorobiaceae bacterium]